MTTFIASLFAKLISVVSSIVAAIELAVFFIQLMLFAYTQMQGQRHG